MSIEALLLAKRNNYSILPCCNKFDVENPKVAELLYIFYISKVVRLPVAGCLGFSLCRSGLCKHLLLMRTLRASVLFPSVPFKRCTRIKVCLCGQILDFVDTFAIVMRGKGKQLSFLHVYHHVTIFLMYWLNVKV